MDKFSHPVLFSSVWENEDLKFDAKDLQWIFSLGGRWWSQWVSEDIWACECRVGVKHDTCSMSRCEEHCLEIIRRSSMVSTWSTAGKYVSRHTILVDERLGGISFLSEDESNRSIAVSRQKRLLNDVFKSIPHSFEMWSFWDDQHISTWLSWITSLRLRQYKWEMSSVSSVRLSWRIQAVSSSWTNRVR